MFIFFNNNCNISLQILLPGVQYRTYRVPSWYLLAYISGDQYFGVHGVPCQLLWHVTWSKQVFSLRE